MTLIFPILQIFLCLGAALVYALALDWKHALYWFAAGLVTVAVILL